MWHVFDSMLKHKKWHIVEEKEESGLVKKEDIIFRSRARSWFDTVSIFTWVLDALTLCI